MTTSLENPLSSLSSGYFSDSTTFKVKPTIEDIQVVDHEDDEPSVLATKSFLTTPPTTVSTNMPTPSTTLSNIMSTHSNNLANIMSTPPTNVANIMSTHSNNVANIMSTPPTNVANIMSTHSTSVANIMSTPNQPQKNGQEIGTGFSHLEWSSSVPFNVAEEPDDVQGKTQWVHTTQ